MKHLVVLSGAGMSAESGINTFRDANGLWEGHNVMEVASPKGFKANPNLVYEFYNQRRKQLFEVEPNEGHKLLAQLEKEYQITIVTQNVDDLHERAGSTNVMHLHGELRKARSTKDAKYIIEWQNDLNENDKDLTGFPLRPHIVWFGEDVPLFGPATEVLSKADIVLIIGTSLQVYPAAGLFNYAKDNTPIYYIDPKPATSTPSKINLIKKGASDGMQEFIETLKSL